MTDKSTSESWDNTNAQGGLGRRTILKGAAWSVPVIAVAVAAPAAAASTLSPTLTFTNGPYAAAGCATLGTVNLLLTTDGSAPDPGEVVTVTLPDGLTWSDGTTTPRSFTTGAGGTVSLTGIIAPAGGPGAKDFTISATSTTGPFAAALVRVTPVNTFHWGNLTIPNLPVGVTAVDIQNATNNATGQRFIDVLGSDGRLYSTNGTGATLPAWTASTRTDLTMLAISETGGNAIVSNGTAVYTRGGSPYPALPNGAGAIEEIALSVVGTNSFAFVRTSSGRVYRSTNGGSWVAQASSANTELLAVSNSTGNAIISDGTDIWSLASSTPFPRIPGNPTITDIELNVNGTTTLIYALGSDGKVYRYSSVTGTWQTSPATPTGGMTTLVMSSTTGNAITSNGTSVWAYNGTQYPALPLTGGATISQLQMGVVGGVAYTYALTSDGNVYTSVGGGAWSLTSTQPGEAFDMSVSTNGGGLVYATVPVC